MNIIYQMNIKMSPRSSKQKNPYHPDLDFLTEWAELLDDWRKNLLLAIDLVVQLLDHERDVLEFLCLLFVEVALDARHVLEGVLSLVVARHPLAALVGTLGCCGSLCKYSVLKIDSWQYFQLFFFCNLVMLFFLKILNWLVNFKSF